MKQILPSCLMAFCSLISLCTIAQENYQNGYIVLPSNDTVRGQIDFRDWAANPREITFQDARSGQKTTYLPSDLKAFFVNNETYRGFTVRINPYSLDAATLSSGLFNLDPYDTTVFLRLSTAGKITLYNYLDRTDVTYFFVQSQEGAPEQLRIITRMVERDGTNLMQQTAAYKNQLMGLLADCPALAGKPPAVAYSEKALRRLIFSYNNCGKDTVEQKQNQTADHHGQIVSFSPILGYLHSSVRISGALAEAGLSWPSYNGVTGGLGMLLVIPRAREKFSFFTDLLYRHFQSESSTNFFNTIEGDRAMLDFSQLQLDIQFRYSYPEGNIRPFFNIGFSNIFIINNKSTRFSIYQPGNQETPEPIFGGAGNMNSYLVGLIGGAGIMAGRFSLEARFEKTTSLTPVESTNAPLTNLFLLAGFRL